MDRLSLATNAGPEPEDLSRGGAAVPMAGRAPRSPTLHTPASRRAIRKRMLLFHHTALDRLQTLTGVSSGDLKQYRRELAESDLPDLLVSRGAGVAFTRELPQGGLLYLLVRALKPHRVVETGVRPGYSTAWFLAALDANRSGDLVSLGPGPTSGRVSGVHDVGVGQFVAPKFRTRWTLVLGNTTEHLEGILAEQPSIDLFFYDNGPDAPRARFELRSAWNVLSPRGVLLSHHVEMNPAFTELCTTQGLPPQILDPGPPPLGALGMRTRPSRSPD